MGQKVHSQWEKSSEIEKERAISAAKQEVWEQAEHAKKIALDKAKKQSVKELEREIESLKISNERSIKVGLICWSQLTINHVDDTIKWTRRSVFAIYNECTVVITLPPLHTSTRQGSARHADDRPSCSALRWLFETNW